MPRRPHSFEIGRFYHVFNRGVEKRDIYLDDVDRYQFLLCLAYYQQLGKRQRFANTDFELTDRETPYRFAIHAYCLMDNHFHLLLEELADDGIRQGLRHALDSYVTYFNKKRGRVGSLFQGRFKSVPVETDEQFVHVARYIFLNRFVASMEAQVGSSPWNGYSEYSEKPPRLIGQHDKLLAYFGGDQNRLHTFIVDHAGYARSLEGIKHLVLE